MPSTLHYRCRSLWLCVGLSYTSFFFPSAGASRISGRLMARIDPIQYSGTVGLHLHSGTDLHPLFDVQGISAGSSPWEGAVLATICQWLNFGGVLYLQSAVIRNSSLTTPFPDDFRMVSGTHYFPFRTRFLAVCVGYPSLRTLKVSCFAQQAVTFLCLNFNGVSTMYNELPFNQDYSSGLRSQIAGLSELLGWKDPKSHVAFPSTGQDNGTCDDPNYL
ncbi:hypothetical protein IW261DRAFT_832181 [Armillaria novae-zelandiae]|uniref:Uncharacterized protein n=1 Tax=Armillaria novae-zelandiae TaxID=153914 RepID=A0AA39TW70_9AGAR|nr:hypothetical protein IW261DRAFT_832181 [Armillaria novae-zelandiae]